MVLKFPLDVIVQMIPVLYFQIPLMVMLAMVMYITAYGVLDLRLKNSHQT